MQSIDLLYFDGCPSWQIGLENLRQAIEAEKLSTEIHLIEIKTPEQAQAEKFLGSPSFRMNGVDLWPEERSRYLLSCRVYHTSDGLRGAPAIEMLREQIHLILAK